VSEIANPLKTLSQVILDVLASCGWITANPDGTRKSVMSGSATIQDLLTIGQSAKDK
jgi:hypothetical protein